MKNNSFKLRIIFSYVLIITVSLGVTAFFLDKNLENNSLRNIESSLMIQAAIIEGRIAPESVKREDSAFLEGLIEGLSREAKCRITIINNAGKVLADSGKPLEEVAGMENHLYRPEIKSALAGNIGTDTRYSATLKIDMLYTALPIRNGSEIIGALRLALPLVSVQKTLFEIRKTIFFGLLFSLCLAFILGWVMAERTTRPINKIIQVSRKFAEGDFSRRIIHTHSDEIGELATILNKMAQEIEDKISQVSSQNQRLAAVFNSMIEGVVVVDKASRIISVNPTIERILGIREKEAEGRMFLDAVRNNDISDIINSVLKNGKALSAEMTLVYPIHKIFEVNAAPIFSDGKVTGCLAVIHDITEIKRLETVRRDFIANAAHELKTPLTSIKGFVETLLEGALNDKENARDFLNIIGEHTDRLDTLVNDLLSLSHIESNQISLDKKDVKIRQEVEKILLAFKAQLKKKNIDIRNELSAGLSIRADNNRLDQVFTNLIDNAIKFNKEKGLIKIYSQDSSGATKITVEDSGIGIPDKDIPRIFERFYRVDKARSRELGGTGLGLSIVKHIIELHEGSVGVESIEGAGSKFWFTIPR